MLLLGIAVGLQNGPKHRIISQSNEKEKYNTNHTDSRLCPLRKGTKILGFYIIKMLRAKFYEIREANLFIWFNELKCFLMDLTKYCCMSFGRRGRVCFTYQQLVLCRRCRSLITRITHLPLYCEKIACFNLNFASLGNGFTYLDHYIYEDIPLFVWWIQ